MGRKKTLEQYENEIRELHATLQEYPESETIKKRLSTRLRSWADRLEITVFVANNEQTPWSSEDIGFPTHPMYTKAVTGFDQVGDYQAHIHGGSLDAACGLLVERKGGKEGPEDIYGTLMNSESRARFYREIDRFREDVRYNQMIVIAECSYEEFLRYTPRFIGKTRNRDHIGASVASRVGTIASLYAQGIPVLFAGSRMLAAKMYGRLVKQWAIKNYEKLLNLEATEDTFEAELKEDDGETFLLSIGGVVMQVPKNACKVIA